MRTFSAFSWAAVGVFTFAAVSFPQATDGNLVGSVLDPSGAAIPNVTLELDNTATGVKLTATSRPDGSYRFNNVLVGKYKLTASAAGFTTATVENITIELNRTVTSNVTLQVGSVATVVDVTAAAALIDTTTAQVGSTYGARETLNLPSMGQLSGVLNLSLLGGGVASAGGYGLGEGPSIGGQRPRQNNFTIEGVDNNRKDVTGSTLEVPNESVEQFTLLQNQFSAEFGHSTGGQFNSVIRGGSNEIHGAAYWYLRNRDLNAVDQAQARQGVLSNPRLDNNRIGGRFGGPIKKNKLFYYGNFEYNPLGESLPPSAPIFSPTAAGYSALDRIPGLSATNLGILKQYASPAPTASDTTSVNGVAIPIGTLPVQKPYWENNYFWVVSGDYNISDKDQLRGRYIGNRKNVIDNEAALPVFFQNRLTTATLAQVTEVHVFSPSLTNELRLAYRRYNDNIPAGNFQYPGLDAFPNITLEQDLNLNIGPDPVAPQSGIENGYQLVNNLNWVAGKHTLKFGFDGRRYIATTHFIQRERGDYYYSNLERFLMDLTPDVLAQRNVGGVPYVGNQWNLYWFVNDEWRVRRNFTLNLGVRHEYKGIGRDLKQQTLNAVSNTPGLIMFDEPQPQLTNFAPRVGIAYSPGQSGRTSIRAGFGMGYDVFFDNFGTLQRPVQLESTIDDDTSQNTPGYLAKGGITPSRRPATLTPEEARAFTSAWLSDQLLPYSIQWNFGVQHVIANDFTVEARYLGTRGVHLFIQNQINRIPRATPQRFLPTFMQQPSQAQLDAQPLTLRQLTSMPNIRADFLAAGFETPITAFESRGNSSYNGLVLEVTRRFARGLWFKGAYTWSHAIDDSGADLFSTLITPRRPQNFQDLRSERSSSFLDRRHRFTYSWVYDVPWFRGSHNWFLKNVVGNFNVSGTYTYESPQLGTVQSGVDSNLNGDAAGDRVIVNPNGRPSTGSGVRALTNSAGDTVGYLALDPNAQYIVAGAGALATGGRNTVLTNPINNFDLQVIKGFNLTESKRMEFRAGFWNAFNHPQYIPGRLNSVYFKASSDSRNNLIPGNALFNRHDQIYDSNAREIQLGLRFEF